MDPTAAEAAFKSAAQQISQGPNAVQGGDLGWVEPGVYTPVFDRNAFACKTGELSPVFLADQVAYLVLITAREEARVRPLDEVRGEMEAVLNRERREEIKANAVAMLRSKASIRDLSPLTDRKIMEILALPLPR